MLDSLRVRAFAIIEDLEVRFAPGFNALTGETGAGKSILVDALHLVLGGRAQADSVRTGAEEAEVEALFRPRDPEALDARLSRLGLPSSGAELLVRRVVQREGRSRAYVNGAMATAAQLQAVTSALLDISGQHEHVGLLDAAKHLELLDAHARVGAARAAYQQAYGALEEAERARAALDADESARAQKADFLKFQLDELDKADPQPGEDEKLAQDRRVLAAAEKLRAGAEDAEELLRSGEAAAVTSAQRALKRLDELAQIDAGLGELAKSVRSALAELDEAARALGKYADRLQGDPQRLAEIDERLELLRRLSRKHGGTLQAAIERREKMKAELEALLHHDEALAGRQAEVQRLGAVALKLGRALSEQRRASAEGFTKAVAAELAALGMARTELAARFSPVTEGGVTLDDGARLGPHGLETAELLLSPNVGEELRPLQRIASGGELSRVLLAVKRVLAETDPIDTYLFDEVDAGIGGATGEAVGRALATVAQRRQVIVITHLPQIAAFAQRHQVVEKEVLKGRTHSRVAPAEGDERVRELARLLSGQITPAALQHASELLAACQAAPARKSRRAG
jgi:DNA repair protein RecN (Recombination protein N)